MLGLSRPQQAGIGTDSHDGFDLSLLVQNNNNKKNNERNVKLSILEQAKQWYLK